jgi:hypothetical protein
VRKLLFVWIFIGLILQPDFLWISYQVQQSIIRYEVAQLIEKDLAPYCEMTLSLDEYRQSRVNENEICLNGNMYDIKSLQISGDEVKLIAFKDAKEKRLIERISALKSESEENGGNFQEDIQSLFAFNYISTAESFTKILEYSDIPFSVSLNKTVVSHIPDTESPPPKRA